MFRDKSQTEKISKLEETLDSMMKIRHQLEETNKTLEKENQELREEKIELKGKVESLQTVMNIERQKSQDADQLKEYYTKKHEEMQKQLQESQERQRVLQMDMNSLNCTKSKAEENVATLDEEHAKLQNVIKALDSENKFLTDENLALEEKLKEIEEENKSISEQREKLERCLKDRHQHISNLQQELSKISSEKKVLEQESKEKTCKLEHEGEIQTLEEKMSQCQLIFMENEDKFQDVKGKLSMAQKECMEKDQLAEKMSKTLIELKTAYDNSLQNINSLKGQLQARNIDLQQLQVEKENERAKLVADVKRITVVVQEQDKEHQQQNKMKEDAIYTLNTKLKQLADIVDTDKDHINQLHDRINFLSSKSEELNNSLKSDSQRREELQKIIGKKSLVFG